MQQLLIARTAIRRGSSTDRCHPHGKTEPPSLGQARFRAPPTPPLTSWSASVNRVETMGRKDPPYVPSSRHSLIHSVACVCPNWPCTRLAPEQQPVQKRLLTFGPYCLVGLRRPRSRSRQGDLPFGANTQQIRMAPSSTPREQSGAGSIGHRWQWLTAPLPRKERGGRFRRPLIMSC